MAYNSRYTGAQVDALLDRAGEAPQTYDIGWLLNLLADETSATLTEAQFNEVYAASVAGKIFTYRGNVYTTEIIAETDDYTSIVLFHLYATEYIEEFVITLFNNEYSVESHFLKLITKDDLTGYAKTSDLPTKTSQLTNDSGFITADDVAIPKKTVVKTVESNIGYGNGYSIVSPSIELAADKFHIVGKCQGLTITLPEGADTDGQEYCCQFYVGTTSFTLTLPESVYWLNGEAPEFKSNTCCQLVIVNNCAVIGVFKASSE